KPCVPERVNSLGMRFVLIPPGEFSMGSPKNERGRRHGESPIRKVEITRPFYLGAHPVTQGQYRAVMRANPSHFRPGGHGEGAVEGIDISVLPVENVSWEQASEFCRRLSR